MKVKELIERLSGTDQDAEVHFSYNYGDYWRTQVAPCVESIDEGMVTHSDYHNMDKLVDYEDFYDKDSLRRVVLIG